MPTKPKCTLIGTDGNVFALAGKVSQTLKRAGVPEQAKEFMGKLLNCGSYDEALALMTKYVEVEGDDEQWNLTPRKRN